MKYQVRYRDIMSDAPVSELFDDRQKAVEFLEKEKEGKHPLIAGGYYIFENRQK